MQFYGSKVYVRQLKKAQNYEKLNKVVVIVITKFNPFPRKKKFKTIYKMIDIETGENDLDAIAYVFISLPMLKKKFSKLTAEEFDALTILEKWGYFFRYVTKINDEESVMKLAAKDEIIKEAFEAIDWDSWTSEERLGYDLAERNRLDIAAMIGFEVTRERSKAKKKIAQVEKQLAKVKKEIIAVGKKSAQEKILIAKNFLAFGLDVTAIASAAGLNPSQVEALKSAFTGNSNPVFL